ncbi:hypothetical protein KR200_010456 [Drosophila serrata]|nr:hypothetical protein KR200_010456 [Drosophila serrata]
MENRRAVNLKQQFDSHKAQSKQLETQLLTTINEKDSTIEELQQSLKERDVLRIDNMQAEYQVIQEKYNKLQEEYGSLERTSNASEDQCQKLLADNKRLHLKIGTLKERMKKAQRKLLEASSQDALVEEFKDTRNGRQTELEEFPDSFPHQLWDSPEEIERVRKASGMSTERESNFRNGREHLLEPIHQSEVKKQYGNQAIQIKGKAPQLAATSEELQVAEEERLLKIISQLEREVADKNSLNMATEGTVCSLQHALSENSRQRQKLTEDALLVSQLKDRNEKLAESLKQAEARQEQNVPSSEYEEQIDGLRESLRKAKDELKLKEKQKTDEINDLLLEYLEKIERSETENSAKLQESKDLYEGQLRRAEDERDKALDELAMMKSSEKERSAQQTMTTKIGDLEAELQSARLKAASLDDLLSKHEDLKISLSEATAVSATLQEKVDILQSQLLASQKEVSSRDLEKEHLRSELNHVQEAKDTASAKQLALKTKLQTVEEEMAIQAGKFEKELTYVNSSMIELQLKLKSLEERKDNLEAEIEELNVKLRNVHNLRNQLEEEQKLRTTLRTQVTELEETKTRLEEVLRNKDAEVKRKFLNMSQEVELGRHSLGELTMECDKLRSDLETKTKSFQTEKEGLNSNISTLLKEKQLLEERIKTLNMKDNRNAELIAKLKVKEAESESLREVAEEANIKCQQYMDQKVKLTKEIEKLRTTLKAKEKSILTERERMSATISSLLEDKRNLEEKQCTLCERVDKLESQVSALKAININRFDSSIESTSPASVKLRTANNLDSKPIVKKSSINECAVRKEKRKTAHDEHRKQSCWNDSRDFGTMTDPEGKCCLRSLKFRIQLDS